jgi:HAD superfamily hydrolase (TIGR01509 family)
VGLLSNDSSALLDKLRTLEIDDLFDPLVISAVIGVMKPDARAFHVVLDRLKCSAERVIFVDDMPANISGAKAVGIHGIHYTTLPVLQKALEPLLKE